MAENETSGEDPSLCDPLPESPLPTLARWFEEARSATVIRNPDAMALATVDQSGTPQVRMVLCRGLDLEKARFTFYTQHGSPKARQLEAAGRVGAVFYWDPLSRQVRITGSVERARNSDSDAYFAGRHPLAQIAAWASDQSRPIASRFELEVRFRREAERFERGRPSQGVPRPPNWGGFVITAESIELWVSREGRLHDRALWTRGPDPKTWQAERLQP